MAPRHSVTYHEYHHTLTHQATAEWVVFIFTHGVRTSAAVRPKKQKSAATLTSRPGKQNTRYNGHHA